MSRHCEPPLAKRQRQQKTPLEHDLVGQRGVEARVSVSVPSFPLALCGVVASYVAFGGLCERTIYCDGKVSALVHINEEKVAAIVGGRLSYVSARTCKLTALNAH